MKKTGWVDLGFIIKQDNKTTLKKPVGAGVIRFIAPPRFVQPLQLLPNPERIESFDETEQLRDRQGDADFEFSCFIKLDGTGATETYSLLPITTERPVYSIFYRTGDGMVFQNSMCVFTKVRILVRAKGPESILQATFSGKFARQRRAGKTVTIGSGSTDTVLNVTVGEEKFFDEGAYIDVGADAGVLISTIDESAHTITLSAPLGGGAPGAGVSVKGHIPTAADSGYKISGWRGQATLGGTNFPVTEVDYTLENFIEVLTDEKNNTDWAEDFIEGLEKRKVQADVTVYFNNTSVGGFDAWNAALNQTQKALVVPVGNQADKIVTINMPISENMQTPELDTSGKIFLKRTLKGLASASLNDSTTLVADSPVQDGVAYCLEGVYGIKT